MFRYGNYAKFCRSLVHLTQNTIWIKISNRAFSLSRQYRTKRTHYEVLGIKVDATTEDIRAAFINKSKECHPDMNMKDPSNHKRFILVNEAYSILSKPLSRRNYDASLVHHRYPEQTMSQSQSSYYNPEDYDAQIRRARDIRNEAHRNSAYYGSAKNKRVSNAKVVAACIVWILLGIIANYFVITSSVARHIKNLDERDAKVHDMWLNAKRQAELYSKENNRQAELYSKEDNRQAELYSKEDNMHIILQKTSTGKGQ